MQINWNNFVPDLSKSCLSEINIENLVTRASGIILDIDNTTASFGRPYIPPENIDWIYNMRKTGLISCLATMNPIHHHIKEILLQLNNIDVVFGELFRPFLAIDNAISKIGLKPAQIVVVNDLYIVLAYAKALGCQTIKVNPYLTDQDAGFRHGVISILHRLENRFIQPKVLTLTFQNK